MEWNNFAPRAAFAWSPRFDSGILAHHLRRNRADGYPRRRRNDLRPGRQRPCRQLRPEQHSSASHRPRRPQPTCSTSPRSRARCSPGSTRASGRATLHVVTVPQNMLMQQPADQRPPASSTALTTLSRHRSTTPGTSRSAGSFRAGCLSKATYLGRAARNLLAQRDVMHLNNIVDPASGMDWYTAARKLAGLSGPGSSLTRTQHRSPSSRTCSRVLPVHRGRPDRNTVVLRHRGARLR